MAHRDAVFVITEGRTSDRWLYYGTLRESEPLDAVGIQFYPIESISSDSASGKQAVLSTFARLRRARKLVVENSSGKKYTFFCVDADHDHLTNRGPKSDHLIYTALPDAESHILAESDVIDIVANVASLPGDEAEEAVEMFGEWQADLFSGWRDWLSLCCAGSMMKFRNCPAAGTPPTRTHGPMGPARSDVVTNLRSSLLSQAGEAGMTERWLRYEGQIDRRMNRIARDKTYAVALKGKWCIKKLKQLTEEHVPTITGYGLTLSEDSILSAAKAQCEFEQDWHRSVRTLVERVVLGASE